MATPFPRLTPPQFASPAKPAVLLIRAVKSSYTTGTLCAICENLKKSKYAKIGILTNISFTV
jgi:hypothetical protein